MQEEQAVQEELEEVEEALDSRVQVLAEVREVPLTSLVPS